MTNKPSTHQAADAEPRQPAAVAAAAEGDRRDFLARVSTATMAGGMLAGYGTAAAMAGRFLYPAADDSVGWRFAARLDDLKLGEAISFVTPSGAKVVIARQTAGEQAENFIALSSVCPHLGCQVHWEAHNDRFFCPCHNGVFDPVGQPLSGPPKQGNQALTRFPLMVEDGLLFIEAPLKSLGRPVAEAVDPRPSQATEIAANSHRPPTAGDQPWQV